MSQIESADPVLALFDAQRTMIRQGQQAFERTLALQRTANQMALTGLQGQAALQRQGTNLARTATHSSLRSMEALFGMADSPREYEAIDEQFAQLRQTQSEVFDAMEQQLELGAESFGELSEEYVDTLEEQTELTLETLDVVEDQTAEGVDQFGEQVREQFARTRDVQSQLEDQFDRQTEQTEELLERQAEWTEQFQQQLEEQVETMPPVGAVEARAPGGTAGRMGERPIEDIDGIGPTFADRLREEGLETVGDLTEATTETVAEAADVSEEQADEWIAEASR